MTEQSSSSPHIHRAVGRVAGRAVRGNRIVNASLTAGGHIVSSLSRVLRALFLETMGLFFLLFTLSGGAATYRAYRQYASGDAGVERVILGVIFTSVFGYFAISSFWRAHRRTIKETK
jgi:hypothetical protein